MINVLRNSVVQSETVDRGRVVQANGTKFGLFDEVLEGLGLQSILVLEQGLQVVIQLGVATSKEFSLEVSEETLLRERSHAPFDGVGQLLVQVMEKTESSTESPLLGSLGDLDTVEHVLLVDDLVVE